jgi:hypothetical protein
MANNDNSTELHTPPHGIAASPLKYVVFAGTYGEFQRWREHYQIPLEECLYVANSASLHGLPRSPHLLYIMLRGFYARIDRMELMETARQIRPGSAFHSGDHFRPQQGGG